MPYIVPPQKVPEVLEDSGDALNLLWSATQPYLRDGLAGSAAPAITRSVVQLMHIFLTKGGTSAGEALVASGAVAPAVHVRTYLSSLRGCVRACVREDMDWSIFQGVSLLLEKGGSWNFRIFRTFVASCVWSSPTA